MSADVAKHVLYIRVRQQMDVTLDDTSYVSQVHGTYHELNTENKVILGSAESGVLVEDLTRGHFRYCFPRVRFWFFS